MSRWWILAVAAVVALAVACGPAPTPEPKKSPVKVVNEKPKTPKGQEVKTAKLPQGMVGKNVTLSGFYEDDEPLDPNAKQVGDYPTRHGKEVKHDVYKLVAPATVIVSTPRGYGSGVIYHKDGWILTNHHVIAQARREDFRMRVTVSLGALSKEGVMQREPRSFVARVHKQDPLRDLAVIKLEDPPKGLSVVKIAGKDPTPGEQVWALGHAGIGLMWAIKGGQISAVGKLSTHLAQLLLIDSQREAQGSDSAAGKSTTRRRRRKLEELRRDLERQRPALVIQSTCDISQGDSGGPMVNTRGELVGLNAFIRGSFGTRKESNFHIHVAEVRKFVGEVPEKAPQLVPDPWTEGGTLARLGDADMDAKVDVLALYQLRRVGLFSRRRPTCYMLDLDQDSFAKVERLPDVREVIKGRAFDAEMTFLEAAGQLYAWFDRDNDGKHDTLLVARKNRPSRVEGYSVDSGGVIKRDASLDGKYLARPALFADAALGARLRAMGQQVFNRRLMADFKGGELPPPDPVKGAGHQGKALDLSGDGKADTISAEGLFSSGHLLDLDQDSLGGLKPGADAGEALAGGKVDAEFSFVTRGRQRWAWYDTDNDGLFDLVLGAAASPMTYADRAWRVGKAGKLEPSAAHLGQAMVRPGLFANAAIGGALSKAGLKVLRGRGVARPGRLGEFPDPAGYASWGSKLLDAGKWRGVGAEVRFRGCKGLLLDLDRDTARTARRKGYSLGDALRRRSFDAEYVQLRCGSKAWSFYDTRGKGRFDLVLYQGGKDKAPATAFVVDAKGQARPRGKAIRCGGLAHAGLFRKAGLRRAFKRLARDLLKPTPDPSCTP
jgi:S1-C subfamily serine protease